VACVGRSIPAGAAGTLKQIRTYLGYDPGGNEKHGCAALHVTPGKTTCEATSVGTADEAVKWFKKHEGVDGLGVDTATAWSGGHAGDRPADLWLRDQYRPVHKSVGAPNSLAGSFAINGIYVIARLRESWPDLWVTEALPKVLLYALSREVYKDVGAADHEEWLRRWCGLEDPPRLSKKKGDDHDRDALLAALAAWRWRTDEWTLDLHEDKEVLDQFPVPKPLHPAGTTVYAWPRT